MRGILTLISVCGLLFSILAYTLSFSRGLVDAIFPWIIPLLFGLICVILLLITLEYPSLKRPNSPLQAFSLRLPNWTLRYAAILFLIFLAHLLWVAIQSASGVAGIVDGKYVLESNGRVFEVISQAQYLARRAVALRASASFMVCFYFVPAVYWWFRKGPSGPELQDRVKDREI